MEKHSEITEKIICIVNKMNETAKKPRDFGIGQLLYQSEIHTIEAIGNHGEINAGKLAQVLGITNGAVTQVISKLVQKGLVEKYRLNNDNKKIYVRLTEQGNIADQGHSKFHETLNAAIANYLDELRESQVEALLKLLDHVINNLPNE